MSRLKKWKPWSILLGLSILFVIGILWMASFAQNDNQGGAGKNSLSSLPPTEQKAPGDMATAQQPPSSAPSQPTSSETPQARLEIGYLDLQRVAEEYEEAKKGQAELSQMEEQFRKQIEDLEAQRFLEDAERQELARLKAIPKPTDEQRKRIEELLKASRDRANVLRALQQNTNMAPQERQLLEKYSALSRKMDNEIQLLTDKLEGQLRARGEELSRKLTENVKKVAEVVAKERGITAVVDKQVIITGGVDLTDEVLKRLNAGDTTKASNKS